MNGITLHDDAIHPSRLSRAQLVFQGRVRSVRGWPVDPQEALSLCLAMSEGLARGLSG